MAQKVNSSVWLGPAVVGKAWMHAALLSRGGPHPCIAPYRRLRHEMAFGVLCRWPPTKNPAFSEHR